MKRPPATALGHCGRAGALRSGSAVSVLCSYFNAAINFQMVHASWWYYFSKFTEFFDTVRLFCVCRSHLMSSLVRTGDDELLDRAPARGSSCHVAATSSVVFLAASLCQRPRLCLIALSPAGGKMGPQKSASTTTRRSAFCFCPSGNRFRLAVFPKTNGREVEGRLLSFDSLPSHSDCQRGAFLFSFGCPRVTSVGRLPLDDRARLTADLHRLPNLISRYSTPPAFLFIFFIFLDELSWFSLFVSVDPRPSLHSLLVLPCTRPELAMSV